MNDEKNPDFDALRAKRNAAVKMQMRALAAELSLARKSTMPAKRSTSHDVSP